MVVGTQMRVTIPKDAKLVFSSMVDVVPEKDVSLIISIPFFLKGSSQLQDVLSQVVKVGGSVEILKK